jgi:hypothetical protein
MEIHDLFYVKYLSYFSIKLCERSESPFDFALITMVFSRNETEFRQTARYNDEMEF